MKPEDLRNLFIELTSKLNSVHNELPAELYFHALMGAWLKNIRILRAGFIRGDLRTSILWVQQSRSGKGVLNKVLTDICEKLGVTVVTETEITTAGLIGYPDEEAQKYNLLHNLTEEDPVKEGKNGASYVWQDPMVKGDLGDYEIIIIDEAKVLLEPTKFTEQLLTVLQPVLDSPGWVRKKLRSKIAVEYQCSPTIIATTYYFESMQGVIANQGFFQRVAFYKRDLSSKEILEMRDKQAQNANDEATKEYKIKLKKFISMMQQISRDEQIIKLSNGANKCLKKLRYKYFDQIVKDLTGNELKAAQSFSNTIEELTIKIAGQYAVISGKKIIDAGNIAQAYFLAKKVIDTVITKIEIREKVDEEKEIKAIMMLLKKYDRKVTKMQFYKVMGSQLNWSFNKCQKKLSKLIDGNYIEEIPGEKNTKYLALKGTK